MNPVTDLPASISPPLVSVGTSLGEMLTGAFFLFMSIVMLFIFGRLAIGSMQKISSIITPKGNVGANISFQKVAISLLVLLGGISFMTQYFPALFDFQSVGPKSIDSLYIAPGTASSPTNTVSQTPSTPSAACTNGDVYKESLARGRPLCYAVVCSKVCTFDAEVRRIAVEESVAAGVSYKTILALICRESSGNKDAVGRSAQNGKADCGLMQINADSCTPDIMEPRANIRRGITLFKQKLSAVSKFSYPGATQETLAFVSYNCCANGDNPNNQSIDCTSQAGFPANLPKWACPINPGVSAFNMCAVKDYACDVTACSTKY